MIRVFIGLGSNLGNRREYLERALKELRQLPKTKYIKQSSIYETEPVGIKEQPRFLNMVAEYDTEIPPTDLLDELKAIEKRLGRITREHFGPREIDLDILYYNDVVLNTENICVPHPETANRKFVLIPLQEIAAEFIDPVQNVNIERLLRLCSDTASVNRVM